MNRITLEFSGLDLWVGVRWIPREGALYIGLVPCLLIRIQVRSEVFYRPANLDPELDVCPHCKEPLAHWTSADGSEFKEFVCVNGCEIAEWEA